MWSCGIVRGVGLLIRVGRGSWRSGIGDCGIGVERDWRRREFGGWISVPCCCT